MLLIHVPRITNRLGYTINVIFKHILRTEFQITADIDIFNKHKGPKLCYGSQKVGDAPFIRSCELLFKTTIDDQNPHPFAFQDTVAIFPTHSQASSLPFDVFAASFYCLSRYEEYLPHFKDEHGRFPATESLAYKAKFLGQAVVDRWAQMLAKTISETYSNFEVSFRTFDIEDSIDIDAAFCYKNKGIIRTLAGIGKDLFSDKQNGLIRKRMRVITHKEDDPFDTFDFIIDLNGRLPGTRLIFFPLMADYNVNDKPISYQNNEFRLLLQHLCDYAEMGIHASYASFDDPGLIASEIERLSSLLHRNIVHNRSHFLRLALPQTYNALINCGIQHDYSMGYADEPGFRAGTGTPYPFFNLESDCETSLIIHPFAAMDSTFYFYKKYTAEQSEKVYHNLTEEAATTGCTLSLLWHNQSLCEDFGWEGWKSLYQRVLEHADAKRKEVIANKANTRNNNNSNNT